MNEVWKPRTTHKAVIVILDGVGDRPLEELGEKTPLQVAKKPTLDMLASRGITGIMDLIEPGIRPGTDTGHLALFGYDPYMYYPGRGPIEAAGIGVDLQPSDLALRANFATVEEKNGALLVLDRRAGRIHGEEAEELTAFLGKNIKKIEDVEVFFKHATAHRLVVVLRGNGLSAAVSDSDPGTAMEGKPIRQVEPLSGDPDAAKTAKILNQLLWEAYELLKDHPLNRERSMKGLLPANAIITRGAGMVPRNIVPFTRLFSSTAYVVCEEATVLGIARIIGIDGEIPEGSTADLDTDINSIFQAALNAYEKGYEIVFIHIKGTDIAGHDANPKGKIEIIEKVDKALGEFLKKIDRNNTIITVTADHSTPCNVRDHSGDPVPVLISGPGVRRDSVEKFDEISCAQGGLGRIKGTNLIRIILDLMNKPLMHGE
jgi:2,3-bisphosphoglycerate-independent phosphoglycerate mutase